MLTDGAVFIFASGRNHCCQQKIEREKWQDGTKKSKIGLFYFWHPDNKVLRKFLVVFNIETKCWSFFSDRVISSNHQGGLRNQNSSEIVGIVAGWSWSLALVYKSPLNSFTRVFNPFTRVIQLVYKSHSTCLWRKVNHYRCMKHMLIYCGEEEQIFRKTRHVLFLQGIGCGELKSLLFILFCLKIYRGFIAWLISVNGSFFFIKFSDFN